MELNGNDELASLNVFSLCGLIRESTSIRAFCQVPSLCSMCVFRIVETEAINQDNTYKTPVFLLS